MVRIEKSSDLPSVLGCADLFKAEIRFEGLAGC
jgi:hypothetical protein